MYKPPAFLWLLCLLCAGVAQGQAMEKNLGRLNWKFCRKGDTMWLPAKVPGTVHTDLMANGIIPDPYLENHAGQLGWVETSDWEYRADFSLTDAEWNKPQADLTFKGLDTYAKVWVNNVLVLEADNMFRNWDVPVKSLLKKGSNQIRILFESSVNRGKKAALKLPYTLPGDERVFTRKAQYQYGWDWGPRLVTCGIWQPVILHFYGSAKLLHVRHTQHFTGKDTVRLDFFVKVKCTGSRKNLLLKLDLDTPAGSSLSIVQSCRSSSDTSEIRLQYTLPKARLWWCNGLGLPFQYRFRIQLIRQGKSLDERYLSVGLRRIRLIEEADSSGTSFVIQLNDHPVFIRGANLIPADNFIPRVADEQYRHLVNRAREANMNMLRVWGGGIYGTEAFYEACDKNGILVWQDFMFACAMYPTYIWPDNHLEQEVKDQVERLQNHPSLAIWCGNNESSEGWFNWGWQKQFGYSAKDSAAIYKDYKMWFEHKLPTLIARLDPERAKVYWPSSPQTGWGRKESLTRGDVHYWGVWWGMEPFEKYEEKVGRFVSEYGFQSLPGLSVFQKVSKEKDLHPGSDALRWHQKHPTGYETIRTYMERDYPVPVYLKEYIYVSQLLQARGMKMAIEAHRRNKPYCMGTLFWQLNDCWPVTSWSTLDYFNQPKAAYYQVKRSFAPVLLSFQKRDSMVALFGMNDGMEYLRDSVVLQLLRFNGTVLWEVTLPVELNQHASSRLYAFDLKALKSFSPRQCVLVAKWLKARGQKDLGAQYFFVKPVELELQKPTVTLVQKDAVIELSTDVLAKDVYLSIPGLDFEPDDNAFDLIPGTVKSITCKGINKGENWINQVEIQTLYDVMQKKP